MTHFDSERHTFFEAVVGEASPLLNRTVREVGFRGRYQAAVVAIHRAGQRVNAKIGDVRLRLGDALLLMSDSAFAERWRDRNDFLLVAPVGGSPPVATRKGGLVGLIGLGIVVGAGSGILPILEASLVGAAALTLLGVLTPSEVKSAIDLDVLVVIAGAVGLAAAIEGSGLALQLAQRLTGAFGWLGPQGVLVGVVLATITLTELITNNAAAALMFPIAMSTAAAADLQSRPFAIAVAVAASASFLTPIGYQTNTMVYGLGGYRFGDYFRLGAPLTAAVIVILALVIPRVWPLQ